MRWLAAAIIAAIPLVAGLWLVDYSLHAQGQTAKNIAELQVSPFLMLAIAAGVFFFLVFKVMSRCEYSGAAYLALLGAVLAIPLGLIASFFVMMFMMSMGQAGDDLPEYAVDCILQLALTAPLALGAYVGIGIGNSKQLGQPLY